MKIFSFGLHYSCIADLREIFTKLGHQYDFESYSGHNWVLNYQNPPYELLKADRWLTEFEKRQLWEQFWNDRHAQLDQYDAFVITYPFMWTWLLKKFNKPIIAHIPIRCDYGLTHKPEEWQHLNEYARQRVDEGKLFLCANSIHDKLYAEIMVGRPCEHIPSVCEYPHIPYNPNAQTYAFYLRGGWPGLPPTVRTREEVFPNMYPFAILSNVKAIVHCPYATSTMSIFEFYTMNMPMFVPSHELSCQWYQNNVKSPTEPILWHWCNTKLFPQHPPHTPFQIDFKGHPDPNARDDINAFRHWTQYCDFYDEANMPHIQKFNSMEELQQMTTPGHAKYVNCAEVSEKMKAHNVKRVPAIYEQWRQMLAKVEAAK